jgi:ketosteroid isomerase-like protein
VAPTTASHLSFHVKDDVDLNVFARDLEEECRRRGIAGVVCNRVVHVRSEDERRRAELRYFANKFWNDPAYFVEGYSDSNFGDFYGWSLFYCKGPNGEQLEFNQVTRGARERFLQAQRAYNEEAATSYVWPAGGRAERVKRAFEAGGATGMDGVLALCAEDTLFQLGGATGRGPRGLEQIFAPLRGEVTQAQHRIRRASESGEVVTCELEVTYTRRDGKVITLPCCDVLGFEGERIKELRIYMDVGPLLAG